MLQVYLVINMHCIYSESVILNANVAFLAIQSADNSSNASRRSPALIASYLSLVTTAGAVVLGLLLTRHHRAKYDLTSRAVGDYVYISFRV
jgi:hypothetical protein